MTSGNPQSETRTKTAARAASGCPAIDSIKTIEDWIDRELKTLVEKNSDWQTTSSNRKYFGR